MKIIGLIIILLAFASFGCSKTEQYETIHLNETVTFNELNIFTGRSNLFGELELVDKENLKNWGTTIPDEIEAIKEYNKYERNNFPFYNINWEIVHTYIHSKILRTRNPYDSFWFPPIDDPECYQKYRREFIRFVEENKKNDIVNEFLIEENYLDITNEELIENIILKIENNLFDELTDEEIINKIPDEIVGQQTRILIEMSPERAVSILVLMHEQNVMNILKKANELARADGTISIVPYWLSLMDRVHLLRFGK